MRALISIREPLSAGNLREDKILSIFLPEDPGISLKSFPFFPIVNMPVWQKTGFILLPFNTLTIDFF